MKKVIYRYCKRERDFADWRIVWLIKENINTFLIWSWREPFTRYVHKHALGEKIEPL